MFHSAIGRNENTCMIDYRFLHYSGVLFGSNFKIYVIVY